jgi:2-haloacid dehalogenase
MFLKLEARPAAHDSSRIQAVAFDAFTIFDPRPVTGVAEKLFPGRGAELVNGWRTRQFEYTWLRTVAGHYADFWQVTEEALLFATKSQKLDLAPEARGRLMSVFLNLKMWPDVPQAIKSLRAAGIRLAFLSNFTRGMLDSGINNNGLEGVFEHVLSTDAVKHF